ncbi:MAG: preprotein translocase subunit YajC [Alphaproteobacteria bacterium]|nr:preprotein translocase subunit YajC [Alphaproteobacteria bacterium]MBQ9089978.1 preprotein translocase subunit YajC [Alphaproteobacteria bacterium]
MFISEAMAQTAETATQVNNAPMPDGMKVLVQIGLIFIVLYFFLLRPQQKRMKEHQAKLAGIVKGTTVVVNGIIGKVTAVKDNELTVEIASGVTITVIRDYVSQVIENNKNKKK